MQNDNLNPLFDIKQGLIFALREGDYSEDIIESLYVREYRENTDYYFARYVGLDHIFNCRLNTETRVLDITTLKFVENLAVRQTDGPIEEETTEEEPDVESDQEG